MLTAINKTTTFSRQVKMQTFPTLHTNLWKCSRHTFLKEGFRGFYSGTLPGASEENLPRSIEVRTHEQKIRIRLMHMICQKTLVALVAIAAENSLLFMAYGATQRVVSRLAKLENDELGVLGHGLAGGGQALL